MPTADSPGISNLMKEDRVFPPPPDFAANAHIKSMDEYKTMHARSLADPDGFWGEAASQFHWFKKWDRVVDWNLPDAKWFVGGETNICYNCLDLQIERGLGDHTAILFEGEPGDVQKLSFRELHQELAQSFEERPEARRARRSPGSKGG